MKNKTLMFVVLVAVVHVVVVGLMLIPGCTATRSPGGGTAAGLKPKSAEPARPVAATNAEPRKLFSETTTYVVGPGESLSGIARRFGVTVAELAALNRVTNLNVVRTGQKLVVPVRSDGAPVAVARSVSPTPGASVSAGKTYIVKPGDRLATVAAAHGVTVEAIRKANDLQGDKIVAGRKLVIPADPGKTASTASSVVTERNPIPAPRPESSTRPRVTTTTSTTTTTTVGRPSGPRSVPTPAGPTVPSPARQTSSVERAEQTVPVAVTPPTESNAYRTHIVAKDEDLYTIGIMYAVKASRIRELNGMAEDAEVKAGQRIKIPVME